MGLGLFLLEIGKCPPNSHLNPAIDELNNAIRCFSYIKHILIVKKEEMVLVYFFAIMALYNVPNLHFNVHIFKRTLL